VLAGIVLAAGAATRFGGPKQALLAPEVVERMAAAGLAGVLVVTGAHAVETAAPIVRCPEWERGPGASLRCGLRALGDAVDAAVVALADGPDLSPSAVQRIVEVWRESGAEVVAATYDGNRGHPVLLARSVWSQIPDEGARSLPALTVPCDDLGSPGDVDTPADLPERYRPTHGE
jgi:CTP:molybdopterin cytidylyltransferase MocA